VAKNDKTTTSSHKTNTINTPSVPSTARITKECDGSISMGLTSNEMKTSNSRVGSTVPVENVSETKLLSENVSTEKRFLKYETDKPINYLSDIEADVVIHAVMDHIYPTCRFVAQVDHLDSATCFIFTKIGYRRSDQGKERTKWWACTMKLVMDTIMLLQNHTLDRYQLLAKGRVVYICNLFVKHYI